VAGTISKRERVEPEPARDLPDLFEGAFEVSDLAVCHASIVRPRRAAPQVLSSVARAPPSRPITKGAARLGP
jgi:hypothetical protein